MRNFFSSEKGTSTVEFVLTIFWYFVVVFMIFELGRLALSSAYWDLAITESTRVAKNQEAQDTQDGTKHNYKVLFENALRAQQKSMRNSMVGIFAVKENAFTVDVKYADSISDLLNGTFRTPTTDKDGNIIPPSGSGAGIAQYSLEYDYSFITPFPFLPASWTKSIFSRKIVTVQEYEK